MTILLNLLLAMPVVVGRSPVEAPRPDWRYLDNGTIRIGVKTTSAGAIGYFAPSGSSINLLNHFDQGRFLQQSYYGIRDGTKWAGRPWRWNPVQGGDYKGNPAKLLSLDEDNARLEIASIARHWSGCVDLPHVRFEEIITLDGPVAHVRLRMNYTGDQKHPALSQEIPAVFMNPKFDTLVLYTGEDPWTGAALSRSQPGWPNESRRMGEHWAAYINQEGFGIGVYVPIADRLTCYRFAAGHSAAEGACSYFAPQTTFAITPGLEFEYDAYLTCGTVEQIRARFRNLHQKRK